MMDLDLPAQPVTFKAHNPYKKRIYRACVYCRQRKTKCDLDSSGVPGRPPCQRCIREARECVLGDSNRGKRRKPRENPGSSQTPNTDRDDMSQSNDEGPGGPDDESMAFARIQNPSDALGILAQVADHDISEPGMRRGPSRQFQQSHLSLDSPGPQQSPPSFHNLNHPDYLPLPQPDSIPYQLCNDGILTSWKIHELIARYKTRYHPYFPIVPARVFDPDALVEISLHEQHLLTAILTVSAKDLNEDESIYMACSGHMQKLISALVIGMKCEVEAVEALLILAEWTPHQQNAVTGSIGRGEEDRAAWMYVGMALRAGYYQGLDATSFRNAGEPRDEQFLRHRLVWTACYMSDRQISVRIGRAFWSRGPGPLTGFTRGDFPALHPRSSKDENYASIFQATLELTQIFSNVHELLYTQRGSRLKALLVKDYIKYIDDFRTAIKGWNSVWGTLTCSANLKATLLISYDYLRLYTNAFALQAAFKRTKSSKNRQREFREQRDQRDRRSSFHTLASAPDARFIYEALDAAKSLLVTVNNFVDPETCLRYMPLRFYLYIIYSAVFLYKARFLSVSSAEETRGVRDMITETIDRLQRASVGTHHLGSRYALLLTGLWRKGDPDLQSRSPTPGHNHNHNNSTNNNNNNNNNNHNHSINAILAQQNDDAANQPSMQGYPDAQMMMPPPPTAPAAAAAPVAYDFNWLDLDAVGQFAAMDDHVFAADAMQDVEAMWYGFGIESPDFGFTEEADALDATGGHLFF